MPQRPGGAQQTSSKKRLRPTIHRRRNPLKYLVPEAGLEPARPEEQGILSLRNHSIFTIRYYKQSNNIKEMNTHEFS